MRVFVDTNVLFSGLYSLHGTPNKILEAAAALAIQLVISVDVLQELTRNIHHKAPHLVGDLNRFLLDTTVEIVATPPDHETQRWIDAALGSDAAIIAAALHARVDYFCTGDKRVLGRGRRGDLGGLEVISPAALLRLLR